MLLEFVNHPVIVFILFPAFFGLNEEPSVTVRNVSVNVNVCV